MDEPWDELMGPSPDELKNSLRSTPQDPPVSSPPMRTSSSGSAAPPSSLFAAMPNRWAQHEPADAEASAATAQAVASAATKAAMRESAQESSQSTEPKPTSSKRSSLAFEDEQDDDSEYNGSRLEQDGESIRQEALKMLQVADDSISGNYSVHRTITGGFSATANTDNKKKRVPRALAGVNFTSSRRNAGRPYRDDPFGFVESSSSAASKKSSIDNGYEDDVVNVIHMEQRSAASRPAESDDDASSSSKNWSSRYSIDHTLLALSGGTVSNTTRLNDKQTPPIHDKERFSARNLFQNAPKAAQSPKVFGSGFDFRQKHLFGKQKVTAPTNLKTVWMDMEGSLPNAEPRKSWQEQLQRKRQQRRRYIYVALFGFVLVVTLASTLGTRNSTLSAAKAANEDSLTFYVTSNAPYSRNDEQALAQDLQTLPESSQFLVHLGNLQDAAVSLCAESRYADVATLLQTSPVPTFVLPGEQDWQDCPNPDDAWDAWVEQFRFFDGNFDKSFDVDRPQRQPENFAFVQDGVLVLGVHVIAGNTLDLESTAARNAANVQWIDRKSRQHADEARAIVVLGNARPGHPINDDFFESAKDLLDGYDKPVAYVHAHVSSNDDQESNELDARLYQPFERARNMVAIQVPKGGDVAPLRITVGYASQPFLIG